MPGGMGRDGVESWIDEASRNTSTLEKQLELLC